MVKLDYKKEYKDLYMPKGIPTFCLLYTSQEWASWHKKSLRV